MHFRLGLHKQESLTQLPSSPLPHRPLVFITSELGYRNGIVSTARVTHATPAAAYAVSADRNWEASVPIADTA